VTNPIPKAVDLFHELTFSTSRSGGPGGQNVNKVNSKVTLRWSVIHSKILTLKQKETLQKKIGNRLTTDNTLVLTSQSSRSQLENKQVVMAKLDKLLATAFAPRAKRRATKPTKSSTRKRLESKKQLSEKKNWRKKL